MSEPAFILFFIAAVYFAVRSGNNSRDVVLAALFTGLASVTRINGFFVVVLVAAVIIFRHLYHKRFPFFTILVSVVLLVSIMTPFAYNRAVSFGSVFDVGTVGNIFADSYDQAISSNVEPIGLTELLSRSSPRELFDRFIVDGFLRALGVFAFRIIGPLLLIFFFYSFISSRSLHTKSLGIMILLWASVLSLYFFVHYTPRYMLPMLPFALIIGASGIFSVATRLRYKHLFVCLLVFCVALGFLYEAYRTNPAEDVDPLYESIAHTVKGAIVLYDGDLVGRHLSDLRLSGRSAMDLTTDHSGLRLVHPAWSTTVAEDMAWYKSHGITHILVDQALVDRRPELESFLISPPAYLIPIMRSNITDRSVYSIDWQLYSSTLQ